MKHKLLIALTAITVAVCCAFGFAACGNGGNENTNSGKGDKNPSSGSSENLLKYTLSDDGTYYICNGVEKDSAIPSTIVVPTTYNGVAVTEIGDGAFFSTGETIVQPDGKGGFIGKALDCAGVTKITLPDSITRIGKRAFCGCESLESITIPDGVNFIGDSAFFNCLRLKSVTVPDGVNFIGANAFTYCPSLESIILPADVTEIGYMAFDEGAEITFKGTKAQWNAIEKADYETENGEVLSWYDDNKDTNYIIHCTDGDI